MRQNPTLDSEIFTRAVEDIITRDELKKLLESKKKLRVKLGIDATASELHVGHAVSLWKVRALQEHGHKAVIVLGDFTTQIGDPTGRSKSRPVLPKKTIEANIKAIKKQVEQILLHGKAVYEVRRNSEWYGKMKAEDLLRLTSLITHARLIERDMFQERIKKGEDISVPEFLYPVLQGYDSVAIKSNLTIIGSDQLFNEHVGRKIQEKMRQLPQAIVTIKLLPGLDGGEKMSKSLGNYIGLDDSPQDKFGKAMRTLDSLIIPYLKVYTDVPMEKVQEIERKLAMMENPMEAKLFFAEALVSRYHGIQAARHALEQFLKVFSKGEIPDAMPFVTMRHGVRDPVEVLLESGLAPSKSEARRLIKQGGVSIDNKIIIEGERGVVISQGTLIRVGKRRFVRVR
ncbi:MAG: tyrosine--tRNA ligase [Candidatus Sungbacteria bacterium RIFCSPHIGHO2_02_FULL_47_11]|uniref:Tyrosine--tRNA ligase n=1 Tax=Candidatus Sungbacteria bacterium RIFCSPHIGHO2_02_FULL_47_11 TaxID=1802270 RepID=A0A1G2KK37_9BACT|nr:MAG: tyrosine--tRNA ligase [Candidatus Sungbacteria bacterium RIFCSPHIGHO2_02_FULL_47_11]